MEATHLKTFATLLHHVKYWELAVNSTEDDILSGFSVSLRDVRCLFSSFDVTN